MPLICAFVVVNAAANKVNQTEEGGCGGCGMYGRLLLPLHS